MAATINFYDIFSESIGDGTIDLDTNAIKVALFTNLYTPNAATDVTFSDDGDENRELVTLVLEEAGGAVAASNNLIAYGLMDDTPADVTVTDGNTLTLQWNASGIFTLTA